MKIVKKVILSLLVILCMVSTIGIAKSANYVASDVATVKIQQIDDQKVMLEGTIVSYSGDERFVFQDATGEIVMEIDNDEYRNPHDIIGAHIRAYCEVEVKVYGTSVEADRVEIL